MRDTRVGIGYGKGERREHFPKPVWRVQILVDIGWYTVAGIM